jgi:twitching motility protein PilT
VIANDSSPQEKFNQILELAVKKGASDIHLKAGIFPIIRKHGVLRPIEKDLPRLDGDEILEMAYSIMDQRQKEIFLRDKEIDLGHGVSGLGRFRINLFMQRGTPRMVVRNIPHNIPDFADLNLPSVVEKIAGIERGLVLVTGITGSGKSSTLAAMIN